jgi:hypothetical protein
MSQANDRATPLLPQNADVRLLNTAAQAAGLVRAHETHSHAANEKSRPTEIVSIDRL